jgi:ribosomal-protein-serine acetyltransferase
MKTECSALDIRSVTVQRAAELFTVIDRERVHLRARLGWVDDIRQPGDVARYVESSWKAAGGMPTLFTSGLRGEIVGVVEIVGYLAAAAEARLGYWVVAQHQGRGFATAGSHRVVQYGFQELHLSAFHILCATDNQASARVAEKLGARRLGIEPAAYGFYGRWLDQWHLILTDRQWRAHIPESAPRGEPALDRSSAGHTHDDRETLTVRRPRMSSMGDTSSWRIS